MGVWARTAGYLLWATLAGAQPQELAPAAEPPPLSALQESRGRIAAIDLDGSTLTLSGPRPLQLRVDASTTIFLGGRLGDLEDLAEGQQVRAAYEVGSEGAVAQWIELTDEARAP